MEETSAVTYELNAGVVTLTLNRPEVLNSFNKPMALLLQQHLNECHKNDKVRAVVITGAGKAFCAGQDLAEVTTESKPKIAAIVEKHYNPIIQLIRKLNKPVVAAVNGVAAGAGANIALACDIVVAKETATFVQAFSKIGLIPDSGGTFFLPRLVGMQRASALMMTGDKVGAADALAMGMIYKVYTEADFNEEVNILISKLASMPTKGLAYTKALLNTSFNNSLEEQLNSEAAFQHKAGYTSDFKEGVEAFIEKRQPNFKGQ